MLRKTLSLSYKIGRSIVKNSVFAIQKLRNHPRDLEEVIEMGDWLLEKIPEFIVRFPIPETIGVNLHDLHFPSPLILSSFKENLTVIDKWMKLGLGGVIIKTVMRDKRFGNPRPRIQELADGGFLNAMGLPCNGIDEFVKELKDCHSKGLIFSHKRPVGISIGGSSPGEYISNFDSLCDFFKGINNPPHFYEINISCPNTPDGLLISSHPELLSEILIHMRQATESVVFVKLSQDMPDKDILAFAGLAGKFEKTGLNLGNTSHRTCREARLLDDAISTGGGGLSGPSLYGRVIEIARLVVPEGIPVISTGGIDSFEKVKELLDCGVNLIGMASAVVKDMFCIPIINSSISAYKKKARKKSLLHSI